MNFKFLTNLFSGTRKPFEPLIVNPGDIEYCPVQHNMIPDKIFIKQPCRTVYPPSPASFNEVFANVSAQLNASVCTKPIPSDLVNVDANRSN